MLILELEDDERRILMRVVEERLRELHEDVCSMNRYDLHNEIWREERTLKRLRERLTPIPMLFDTLTASVN
jgi:hypothetical protein